jgi:nicotinate-nucleotide--dimethylbenzimidazole phosphoribosyltransferase
MTDTGQIPEGGVPERAASARPEQPAQPQPQAPYPFPAQADEAGEGEDEELLMPGAPGAWADAVVAPPATPTPPSGTPTQGAAAGGTPSVGVTVQASQAGSPSGTPASGTPAQGTAAAGPPASGTPASGTPASGTPASGTPVPAGASAQGTPPSGTPAPAEPGPGTAATGASAQEGAASGTPASGTPVPAGAAPESATSATADVPAPDAAAASTPASGTPVQVAVPPGATPSGGAPEGAPVQAGPPEAPPPSAVPPGTPAAGTPSGATPAAGVPQQEAAVPPLAEESPATAAPSPQPGAMPAQAGAWPSAAPAPAPVQTAAPAAPVPAPRAEPEGGQPFPEAERDAVHRLMRERRDVRHGFRPDPIPHDVLLRVLEAAHTAPSVGLSQPWDFVIIRSPETRQAVHELAARQRETYAKSLPRARARQFKELRVEAILDTPVNIVVTADPTRGGGRQALGPLTHPQLAPYSSALAVENLWLAARAEGLGVGWVGFFDERELVRALELPDHLEIVAYLCVGYVDEFPDEAATAPGAPSQRRPLSWVVHEESYGRRALPGAEPHDLLAETLAEIRPLDAQALGEAWERQKRMTKPAGSLGALEAIAAQLCGLARSCPPPVPEPAAVAVFAGDHGVHAQGVTPWPQEVTAQMVANFLGGGAVCNAFANQVGAEVCVIDVGVRGELPSAPGLMPRKVRPGTADFTAGPAMTRDEALRAVEVGIETARDLVAAGNRALLTGEMGIANTTVSAALIAVFTGADPGDVTGRGTGIDDDTHARKIDAVRRALERHQLAPADPLGVLAAVGGLEHAALTGLILGGASLRVPVILDGVSAGAAALAARAIAPEAVSVCVAGHRSAEPGHLAALTALGLRPLVDLDLRLGEGTGALLALPVVQSAARALCEVATFDSAGVTDKN